MTFRQKAILPILFVAVTLTACGSGNRDGASSGGIGGAGGAISEPAIADGKLGLENVTQSIVRTGDLTLETNNVEEVFSAAKSVAIDFDGKVENSSFQDGSVGFGPSAYLTVRIPEAKLDEAIEAISKLGNQTALSVNTFDVTIQVIDLKAKVEALTSSRDRLQEILSKAQTTAELISGEQALANLQGELDSYQSQLKYLETQVAQSTLNIQIISDQSSITSGLKGFKETLLQAARGFLEAIEKAFVFIITAIPWVLILGVFVLAGWALVKMLYRRVSHK